MTSWEEAANWYDKAVGKQGSAYHCSLIIPGMLRLLGTEIPSFLDLGCGQGVMARHLPHSTLYYGIDLSPSLIKRAKELTPDRHFEVSDFCQPFPSEPKFTHAGFILSLQNTAHPEAALSNASNALQKGGTLILVLNHPCFRIPRQSHWGVDDSKKLQFRRIDRYLSPLKIPIATHPGKGKNSPATWSYHYPLSAYSRWLMESGFSILVMEEWGSDKASQGKNAVMENRARNEFPLFLAIKAQKL